ncbi:MAG: histidine kinase N-terminal 7TM domain-containing protein [Acholeplasma sp.]|nr:histidine kinase N-terminal 7TM domain-containing protein [Acholeplasma sp.]
MSIELILINIYLFVSLIAIIFMIGYAIPKKQSPLIRQIGLLTFLTFIYVLGYLIELNALSLEVKRFWNGVQYLVIPIIPPVWLLIAMNFIGLKLKKIYKIFIFLIPMMTYVMRFTNQFHQLFYASTYLENTQIGILMSIEYGLFYYFQVVYILFCFVFANILYLLKYNKVDTNQKKRIKRISLSSLAPWLGVFLNIIFAKNYPLDYSVILFPIAILLIIFSLKDEHRISISPFARNLMFMSSSEGVIVVNRERMIIDFNDKAKEIFVNINELYLSDIRLLKKLLPAFPSEMKMNHRELMKVSNCTYQVYLRGVFGKENEILGYVYSFSDITENINLIEQLKSNEERIKELIYLDVLTGVHNRNYLDYYIKENKYLQCSYILMIDMNELKYTNDHFGHQKGDEIIISLVNLIMKKLSNKDELIRLSGDEFLIFTYIHSEEKLKTWIQSLKAEALSIQYLSFAIGYAKLEEGLDFSMMYKIAEDRMYQNKIEMKKSKEII